ncbi:MAG: hydrogenase iron-sulfur subunit [Pseudomonadota bacterium]
MLNSELQTENIDCGTKKLSVLVVGKGLTACIVTSALESLGIHVVNTYEIRPSSELFHSCDQESLEKLLDALATIPSVSRTVLNSNPIEIVQCDDGFSVTFDSGLQRTFACVFLGLDTSLAPIPEGIPKEAQVFRPEIKNWQAGQSICFLLDYKEITDSAIGLGAIRAALDNQFAGGQSVVVLQHTPVKGLFGESLYETARIAGVKFIRFGEQPPRIFSLEDSKDGANRFRIDVRDVIKSGDNISVECHEAFVATNPINHLSNYVPEVFTKLLSDETDIKGNLIQDSVHCLAGKSFRRGVYCVGPACGCVDLLQTMNAAATNAVDAKSWIKNILHAPFEGKMTVSDQCVRCLTCLRLCPHMAISLKAEPSRSSVIVSGPKCLECGICVAECPMSALDLDAFPEGLFLKLMQRLREDTTGKHVVVFGCYRSAGRAMPFVQMHEEAVFFPVSCAGRLSESVLSTTVLAGARGVLVLGCHHGNCRSNNGTDWAKARVESICGRLNAVLSSSVAVSYQTLAANEPAKMAKIINDFIGSTKKS